MTCKANSHHLKFINRLKKIDNYKNDTIAITINTWSLRDRDAYTRVSLWSADLNTHIFEGFSMLELERFINKKRAEAGLFQLKS